MCGIAGWILKEKPSRTFVLMLGVHIEQRGRQSYGLYDGDTDQITRGVGQLTRKLRAESLRFKQGFFHTRFATTGAVTAGNSHPFVVSDVVGAHNGMIYNHAELNKKYSRKYTVDSQHLFGHIAQNLPMDELEGYGTVEYVRDGRYYVAASNHGELEVALLEDGQGTVWASTRESIENAAFQAGVKIKHFFEVKQDYLYEVKLDGLYECDASFTLAVGQDFTFGTDKFKYDRLATAGSLTADSFLKKNVWERELEHHKDRDSELEYTAEGMCDMCAIFGTVNVSEEDGALLCEDCLSEYEEACADADTVDSNKDPQESILE